MLLRDRFEMAVRQHEEEDASIRRDHEGAMAAGEAISRRMEELNRRTSETDAADVAAWENLRADYSWALEEGRRVMEVSECDYMWFAGFERQNLNWTAGGWSTT